jgi:hypothetical protein
MKNTTFADQPDAIRTLTEEEMAVVSGGLSQAVLNGLRYGTLYGSPLYNSLLQSHYTYRPSNNHTSISSLSFLKRLYLNFSDLSNAGNAIFMGI